MVKQYSYRDPDGYVVGLNDQFYRIVYQSFHEDLRLIEENHLLDDPKILRHLRLNEDQWPAEIVEWINTNETKENILAVFLLTKIHLISYPWEWTPAMLKDAALLTLELQATLLDIGLVLKDASFFNIQFINSRPVFIDLLSIKKTGVFYPWHAYGQFLRHFAFPLIALKYGSFTSTVMISAFQDGLDKNTIANLVPVRSYFNIYELINIHLLNAIKDKGTSKSLHYSENQQKNKLKELVQFNTVSIKKISLEKFRIDKSDWGKYYSEDVSPQYQHEKEKKINEILSDLPKIDTGLDLGANTGIYSRLLLKYCDRIISVEQDLNCCELIRKEISQSDTPGKEWTVILGDLLSPSPALGWMNKERLPLLERIRCSLVLSLALVHHLYFTGSIYFDEIAKFYNSLTGKYLIFEFIHTADAKVQLLAGQNPTRLHSYTKENLVLELSRYFCLKIEQPITETRTLFLFEK